jgi:hypothetical protein
MPPTFKTHAVMVRIACSGCGATASVPRPKRESVFGLLEDQWAACWEGEDGALLKWCRQCQWEGRHFVRPLRGDAMTTDPVTALVVKLNQLSRKLYDLPEDSVTWRDERERSTLIAIVFGARERAEDLRLLPPDQRAQRLALISNSVPWVRLAQVTGLPHSDTPEAA